MLKKLIALLSLSLALLCGGRADTIESAFDWPEVRSGIVLIELKCPLSNLEINKTGFTELDQILSDIEATSITPFVPEYQPNWHIVHFNSRAYSFKVYQRKDSTPHLQIPDPGGQMDMVPRYPEQLEWIDQKMKGIEDIDCEWGTVWQLKSRSALASVLEILENHGYLEDVSYETDDREWIERLIRIRPLNTIRVHKLFMLFYHLKLSNLPGLEGYPVEELRVMIFHRRPEETATIDVEAEASEKESLPIIQQWFEPLFKEFPDRKITKRSMGLVVTIPTAALDAVFDHLRKIPIEHYSQCYASFHLHEPVSMD